MKRFQPRFSMKVTNQCLTSILNENIPEIKTTSLFENSSEKHNNLALLTSCLLRFSAATNEKFQISRANIITIDNLHEVVLFIIF